MVELEDGRLSALMDVDPKDGKMKYVRWSPDADAQRQKVKNANAEMVGNLRKKSDVKIVDKDISSMAKLGGF